MRRALLVLCCAAVCAASVAVPASRVRAARLHAHRSTPPCVDPFRPPDDPLRARQPRPRVRHRRPARRSRAVADGAVTFAGSVAGTRHVTVLHADGVRTTYSFLAAHRRRGRPARATRAHRVGHHGRTAPPRRAARRRLLRPASLFDAGPPQVHLVPFDEPPGSGAGGERSAISQLIGGLGAVLGRGGGAAGAVGTLAPRRAGRSSSRTMAHYAQSLHLSRRACVDAALTAWHGVAAGPAGRRPAVHRADGAGPADRRADASRCSSPGSGSNSARLDDR